MTTVNWKFAWLTNHGELLSPCEFRVDSGFVMRIRMTKLSTEMPTILYTE